MEALDPASQERLRSTVHVETFQSSLRTLELSNHRKILPIYLKLYSSFPSVSEGKLKPPLSLSTGYFSLTFYKEAI